MNYRLRDGVQTLLQEAGEAGCYALCLIDVASEYLKKPLDIVESLLIGIERNCIHYNWADSGDNDNFYVKNPATWLYYLTGKHWSVSKVGPDYRPSLDEFEVEYWQRTKTGSVSGHFERSDFQPIKNSLTVKYGVLHSKRILKVTN